MDLINELKRRNVFKVAVAYAIVVWFNLNSVTLQATLDQ